MVRNMNNRLEQFLAAENISQSQFADTINVARASVSHILAGRNKPGWDFLNNMMSHYPNLNIEWLLTGTGKMYKNQIREEATKTEDLPANLFSSANSSHTKESESSTTTASETDIPLLMDNPLPNIETSQGLNNNGNTLQSTEGQRKITKIMVFYDDNTFIEIH